MATNDSSQDDIQSIPLGLLIGPWELRLCFFKPFSVSVSEAHSIQLSHYSGVIMGAIRSQITSLTIAYSTVYSGADQRKHQSSASLAFVRGIHRWLVNSPHKWPVTRKMFPFDDVIMQLPSVGYNSTNRFHFNSEWLKHALQLFVSSSTIIQTMASCLKINISWNGSLFQI